MHNVEIVNKNNTIKHIMTNDVDFTNQNVSIYMQIKLIHNRLKHVFNDIRGVKIIADPGVGISGCHRNTQCNLGNPVVYLHSSDCHGIRFVSVFSLCYSVQILNYRIS